MSLIKELIELVKAKNEYKRDYRRLEESNLDYQALQQMVDTALAKQIVIEIKKTDGTVILIRPKTEEDKQYKSFMDRYKEQHR